MKARNVLIGLFLAVFAFAAATVITTNNVHGEGVALDANGHRGLFQMDVTQVARGDHSEMRGAFTFRMPGDHNTGAAVVMPHVGTVSFVANVATFGGDAVLRVVSGDGTHEFRGTVTVVATSNRHPHEAGDPDSLVVNFVPAVQGNPTLSFTGNVSSGDIAVTTTLSY